MNSQFNSFKLKRSFFVVGHPPLFVNIDSVLKVPIDAELLSMSELETIAEVTEESLNATIKNWKKVAKDTDFEQILDTEIE